MGKREDAGDQRREGELRSANDDAREEPVMLRVMHLHEEGYDGIDEEEPDAREDDETFQPSRH